MGNTATIGSMGFGFNLDTAAFSSSIKKAERQINAFASKIKTFAAPVVAVGAGVTAAAAGFLAFEKSQVDAIKASSDSAEAAGLATDSYMQLKAVFSDLAGGSDAFQTGVGKLNLLMGEAAAGSVEAQAKLAQFGVLSTDTTEQALNKVSNAIKEADSSGEKARLAVDAFGKTGKELVPILNAGADGLAKMRKSAVDTGQALSKGDIATAIDLWGKFDSVGDSFEGALQKMAVAMAPLATAATDVAQKMIDFATQPEILKFAHAFADIAGTLVNLVSDLASSFMQTANGGGQMRQMLIVIIQAASWAAEGLASLGMVLSDLAGAHGAADAFGLAAFNLRKLRENAEKVTPKIEAITVAADDFGQAFSSQAEQVAKSADTMKDKLDELKSTIESIKNKGEIKITDGGSGKDLAATLEDITAERRKGQVQSSANKLDQIRQTGNPQAIANAEKAHEALKLRLEKEAIASRTKREIAATEQDLKKQQGITAGLMEKRSDITTGWEKTATTAELQAKLKALDDEIAISKDRQNKLAQLKTAIATKGQEETKNAILEAPAPAPTTPNAEPRFAQLALRGSQEAFAAINGNKADKQVTLLSSIDKSLKTIAKPANTPQVVGLR